jgi:hypothetical protein
VPRQRGGRDGVRLHTNTLAPDERTVHAGIPVTTVARTLLDLAASSNHTSSTGPRPCGSPTTLPWSL